MLMSLRERLGGCAHKEPALPLPSGAMHHPIGKCRSFGPRGDGRLTGITAERALSGVCAFRFHYRTGHSAAVGIMSVPTEVPTKRTYATVDVDGTL